MIKQDKEKLQNKVLTESLLIGCLATCETVISKNAYLEKKWKNHLFIPGADTGGLDYREKRLQWMIYREKLCSLLLSTYSMKQIIQMTKSWTDRVTQKTVVEVVELIDKKNYIFSP